ncbi:MAG: OmpA family protein [Micrococcales bacterium]|nr:OmpA family protein [Micrococcales bacterium]
MMRRRALLASAGAVVLAMCVGVVPASAKPDKNDLDAALADLDVTPEMVVGSTFDIVAANATFDIKSQYSEFGFETTEIIDENTVVTLAADLLFEFGKYDLTDPARAALADSAKKIPQGAAVSVDGYTDSISGDDINIPLSQARAKTVADALGAARPDLVLTSTGHGSANPVAPNTDDDGSDNPVGRQLNRRVTLTYTT